MNDLDKPIKEIIDINREQNRQWKARAEAAEEKLKAEQKHSWQFLRRAEIAERERDAFAAELDEMREAIEKACTDTGCLNSYTEASCDPSEPGCPMCILETSLSRTTGTLGKEIVEKARKWELRHMALTDLHTASLDREKTLAERNGVLTEELERIQAHVLDEAAPYQDAEMALTAIGKIAQAALAESGK